MHTETALLTTFRVHLHGELQPERLLNGLTIVEEHDGATILATADPDAEQKLRSCPAVNRLERLGRAIVAPEPM